MHNLSEFLTALATFAGALVGVATFYLNRRKQKADERTKLTDEREALLHDAESERKYYYQQNLLNQKTIQALSKENTELKQKISELERGKQ